jgi:hypothetical protein
MHFQTQFYKEHGMTRTSLYITGGFLLLLLTMSNVFAQAGKKASPSGVIKKPPVLTLDKLAQQSEVIAAGTVTSMTSEWNEDKSRIQTRVQVAVEDPIKGTSTGSSISIVIPGGEVEGIGELYTHSVKFQQNEEVVVFAAKDDKGNLRVTNGEQGKFLVKKDNASGAKTISDEGSLTEFKNKIRNSLKSNKQ